MTTLTKILDVSTTVAFVTPNHSWVLGKVSAYDMKTKHYTCTTTDPEPMSVSAIKANSDCIWAPRVEYLEEEVDDLLQLTELHEATLLFCLKRRYFKDIVYTNIGPIVVALNPFNYNIPWYMDSKMPDYLSEGVEIEHNLPHSWAVAHNTYWEMVENRSNQTILISGESGAGKTEAAKIVVKYLGALSTKNGTEEQQEACRVVNRKVNAASPILEAFGNAKTVRNDNSSRFGKFAKIQFDRDGFLIGSFSIKYLLEKSRIITAAQDERVYHSFYQLAQSDAGKGFHIRNPKLHRMLSSGSCITIENVDDGVDFVATQQAMCDVNVSEASQQAIWLTVAGILFFQNIEFEESDEKAGLTASIDPSLEQVLGRACELWGMDPVGMKRELLTSTIVARGESTVKVLSKAQAADTRDSISKGLYDWLFDWLVNKINDTVDCSSKCERWIGLLDIFGFENFTHNSFEQLCINLANETLQNHYNHHIFTRDMKECQEEGIDTTDVRFVDNKECIDLLTSKTGIFTMLDDECMVNGTERNLLQKLNANFMSAKSKPGHPFFGVVTGKAMDNAFKIKHYAADVTYTIDSFLDKNKETLKDGMKTVLAGSTVPLIQSLIPAVQDGGSAKGGGKVTVGMFFRRQLQELMDLINTTNPHWIRCIKPHPAKQPRMFSHNEVMTQLRSAGVLDTVKVRKAGYPIRFKIDVFLLRYRILIKRGASKDSRALCTQMFDALEITPQTGQLGKTKVFLRQEAFTKLNHAKDQATQEYAHIFQRLGRACHERAVMFKSYVKRHHAKIMEERRRREEALKKKREEEELRRQAEAAERIRREEADKERRQKSAVVIQQRVRGMLSRGNFARSYIEGLRAHEERRLDDTFQRYRATFEDIERRVRNVEKKHLEVETGKVVAIKQTHDNKRKEMYELREERTRSIRESEAQRAAMIETEVRADLDQLKRARREKEAKEAQEAIEKRRLRKEMQSAVREHQEEKQIEKLQQMMTNRQLRQNQTSNWQSNLSNRMSHIDAEKDLRQKGIRSTTFPVTRNAGSPTRTTPIAQRAAPIASPRTPTVAERRFEGLKGAYAREETWLASREYQSPETASPVDRHHEVRYRNRILDDAYNRAEMARLLQERRGM